MVRFSSGASTGTIGAGDHTITLQAMVSDVTTTLRLDDYALWGQEQFL
jgi:hypothetical protein